MDRLKEDSMTREEKAQWLQQQAEAIRAREKREKEKKEADEAAKKAAKERAENKKY